MVKSFEDLKEKTLGMTGFFETSSGYPTCYGVYSGNHDDAGGSLGVLQFNWKTGSIQPILKYMFENHDADTRTALGAVYDEIYDVTYNRTIAEQITWGDSISLGTTKEEKRQVQTVYKDAFMALGTKQACIDKQITYSEGWRPNALKWFKTLGLYSRRGYALCWDISVQMGRLFSLNQIYQDFKEIDTTGKTRAQIEEEKLRIICTRCSWDNRPSQYSQIVYDRKIMLINGTGDYYGTPFSMAQYDLNYEPAFEENVERGLYTGGANPPKPNLELTNLYNAVRLDWNSSPYAESYKIYRASSPESVIGVIIGEVPSSTTTYTDNTATGGSTFYYTVRAVNYNGETDSDKRTGFPTAVQVYENKTVDFEGYTAWQVYDATNVTTDFGNVDTLQGGDRLKIDTTGRLRFYLPAGMVGSANTGGIIKAKIAGKSEYTFEYEIRFDEGFPWSKGGKVAGLSGGVGYTGGTPAWAGDGFSVRLMWRENGRIIPYVYHKNQPDEFGDHFGLSAEGIGYFTNTKPHKIKYYVKLNTGANLDGILRVWLDDVQILNKTDICYRTDESKIDTAHLAIFAGGSDETWNMTGDGYIRLSYVQWQ